MIVKIDPKIIIFERRIQGLCRTPYHGHPKGCPNFGKKEDCPPNLPLIDRVLDFNQDLYVIYTEFAVGEFAEEIRQKHPEWNNRQCYNPRYWQPRARKFQRAEEQKAVQELNLTRIVRGPEAHGVNVTALMKSIGIKLDWDWPPEHNINNKTYRVSLGGKIY